MQFHNLLAYCVKHTGSGKHVKLEHIAAGVINQNYCLHIDTKQYLIKQFVGNRWLPSDRTLMFARQSKLAKLGIAPMPLHLSDNQKVYIEQWIGHSPLQIDRLNREECVEYLAVSLQHIHSHNINEDTIALPQHWRTYLRFFPDPSNKWKAKATEYTRLWNSYVERYESDFVLCHNDLSLAHVIPTQSVYLDWEYAGRCCRFFDLIACVLANQFEQATADLLIRRYTELSDYHRAEVQQRVAILQPLVIFTYQLWHKANEHQLAKREKARK